MRYIVKVGIIIQIVITAQVWPKLVCPNLPPHITDSQYYIVDLSIRLAHNKSLKFYSGLLQLLGLEFAICEEQIDTNLKEDIYNIYPNKWVDYKQSFSLVLYIGEDECDLSFVIFNVHVCFADFTGEIKATQLKNSIKKNILFYKLWVFTLVITNIFVLVLFLMLYQPIRRFIQKYSTRVYTPKVQTRHHMLIEDHICSLVILCYCEDCKIDKNKLFENYNEDCNMRNSQIIDEYTEIVGSGTLLSEGNHEKEEFTVKLDDPTEFTNDEKTGAESHIIQKEKLYKEVMIEFKNKIYDFPS
ncbi:hypothetical protein MXB_4153, partial [Myxobolus squamalis]